MYISGCSGKTENIKVLTHLYEEYRNGTISECECNGQHVFVAGINAYDAGSVIYDLKGNIITRCDNSFEAPDSLCLNLKNCRTVYRVKNNIWGLPPVNEYNLGK